MQKGEPMDYQIVLSTDLGLSPADFVAAWNGASECRDVAEARLTESASVKSYDPDLLAGAVAVLSGLTLGLVTNALYDLIKDVLTKKGIHKRTEIVQLNQPDGSHLLIVTMVDEEPL